MGSAIVRHRRNGARDFGGEQGLDLAEVDAHGIGSVGALVVGSVASADWKAFMVFFSLASLSATSPQ
jgi:hypothetical protein